MIFYVLWVWFAIFACSSNKSRNSQACLFLTQNSQHLYTSHSECFRKLKVIKHFPSLKKFLLGRGACLCSDHYFIIIKIIIVIYLFSRQFCKRQVGDEVHRVARNQFPRSLYECGIRLNEIRFFNLFLTICFSGG